MGAERLAAWEQVVVVAINYRVSLINNLFVMMILINVVMIMINYRENFFSL